MEKVKSIALGSFQTNCYIIPCRDGQSAGAEEHAVERKGQESGLTNTKNEQNSSRGCIIIDPGFDAELLLEYLEGCRLVPKRILLTHGHCDHIAGIGLLWEKYGDIPVSISPQDAPMLTNGKANLSFLLDMIIHFKQPDTELHHNDIIEYCGIKLRVLATPGHTPGGVCFYWEDEKIVFVGDTIFAGSIGRCDFPGGDMDTLKESIVKELFVLPDDTIVLAGHGPATTIKEEKDTNPFFN